jgi:hypothetical protein
MEMKKIIITAVLALGFTASAHDEGHGPKLTGDTGRRGGVISAVVLKSEANKGSKASLVHKAELVRTSDKVYVYIYDSKMKPIDIKGFQTKASASLLTSTKNKKGEEVWSSQDFSLDLNEGAFVGAMPKPASKPYNIDVTLKENNKELLSAFDNLR